MVNRRKYLAALSIPLLSGCNWGLGGESDGNGGDDDTGDDDTGDDDSDMEETVPGVDDDAINRPDETEEFSETITDEQTLSAEVVHRVTDDVILEGRLVVEPGTILEFEQNTELFVTPGGSLVADGAEDAPILFTGTESEAGWWNGISVQGSESMLDSESVNNVLDHVIVEYGGRSNRGNVHVESEATGGQDNRRNAEIGNETTGDRDNRRNAEVGSETTGATISITNSTFRHSDGYGLSISDGASISDSGSNLYTDNAAGAVWTSANRVHQLDGASSYTGNGEDVVDVDVNNVGADVIWNSLDVPYRIDDHVTLAEGNLTIDPGATLAFEEAGELRIEGDGEIVAKGTTDEPIVFTGTQETPGWWNGISVQGSESENNVLENVVVEYGGRDNSGNVEVGRKGVISITNSTLQNSDGYGLSVSLGGSIPDSENNEYINNAAGAVWMRANRVHQLDSDSSYTGNGEDVVDLVGIIVKGDATWNALDVPYRIDGLLNATEGDMTIEPGARFMFEQSGRLLINGDGAIVAKGTTDEPIVFTGTQETPGWWDGINVSNSKSMNNVLENVIVEYGGRDIKGNVEVATWKMDGKLTVTDSTLRHSDGWGIHISRSSSTNNDVCEANEFEDNAEGDCHVSS